MKKIISTLIMVILFSTVSYAGQWQKNEYGYKYQNDDGTYKTGWHKDVDDKWYYLDDNSGYMLSNTTTPDGYSVSVDGSWVKGGADDTKSIPNSNYDNKKELEVTAYEIGPKMIKQIGYSLPVTVYYNNEYDLGQGRKMTFSGLETSKDGILYANFHMNEEAYSYEFKVINRYLLEDGTYMESDENIWNVHFDENEEFSETIMRQPVGAKSKPVSAELFIEKRELK